tara:strand:+ start:86 stop:859 length:774 start_codon:yes stop_codon:yes gene_type:complete
MTQIDTKKIVINLIDTFFEAGKICINLRNKGLKTEIKTDNTPVSNGDIEVNNIITDKIKKLTPNIPIVSEENSENKSSNNLNDFWLIDPIDGTYDYINGRDEFTINAALILNKKPMAGIINAPDKKRLFYSWGESNSFEINNGSIKKLNCEKKSKNNEVNAVSYSNNLKPQILEIHKKYDVTNYTKMKSSLKFCVIASGEYDFYAAEPRACEWDIAAGHAILQNSGGIVSDFNENEIVYGKKDFKNPSLILRRGKKL